jgi:prepilin-type N-terminal cleavage/methylation domain-containing protein
MRSRTTPPAAGFTLIEMTIVIVLLSIMLVFTTPMMLDSFRAYEANQTNLVTLSKLRYATERIAREVREVRYTGGAYSIGTMNPTTLSFTKNDATSTVVTINAAAPNVTVQYSTPAMTATLTDQVSSLQFQYCDVADTCTGVTTATVAYVDVALTLTDPNSGPAVQRTRIALRNR